MSALPIPGLITRPDNVPVELQKLPWCSWKPVLRGSKVKKLPLDWRDPFAYNGSIDISHAEKLGTFDQVVWAMRKDPEGRVGIGYVQQLGCNILTFDGDGPRSYEFLDSMNTERQSYYTQSISGIGRHLVVGGTLPHGRGSLMLINQGIEVYGHDRFIAETGIVMPQGNGHVADWSDLVLRMFAHLGPPHVSIGGLTTELCRVLDASDQDVARAWMQCFPQWQAYVESGDDLGDRSETFKAMIGDLDKITGDPDQIFRVMSLTPMIRHNSFNRSKFERRFDGWVMDARRYNTQPPLCGIPRIYWHEFVQHGGEQVRRVTEVRVQIEAAKQAANNAAREEVLAAKPTIVEPEEARNEWDDTPRMQIKPPEGTKALALYNDVLACMHYPNPTIAWVSTIAIIAAITHRSVFVEGDISVAQAIMLLSVTGDGKQMVTDMFDKLSRVLIRSREAHHSLIDSISGEFSHASAIGDKLETNPRITAIIPEGGYLVGTADTVSQSDFSAMQEMMRIRTEGDYGQSLPPKSYALGGARKKDRMRIQCPSLNIIADSQPSTVYALIQMHSAQKGTLNRWWIIDATRDWRGLRNRYAAKNFSSEVAADLLELAESVAHIEHTALQQPGTRRTMQAGGGIDMGTVPPVPISLTAEAIEFCDQYEAQVMDKLSDIRDPMQKAIFVRSLVAAKSLAGVLAVYEHGAKGGAYIDASTMRYALEVVYSERNDLLSKFREGMIGSGDEQRSSLLIKVFKERYVKSKSNHLSTLAKEQNLVSHGWISDQLKTYKAFEQNGGKGTSTLLRETIEEALRRGVLKSAPADHCLRGGAYFIDWDAIKAHK